MRRSTRRFRLVASFAFAPAALALSMTASAQPVSPAVLSVAIGTPASQLDYLLFRGPTCLSETGEPGERLARIGDAALCPATTDGLRAVRVQPDDTARTVALARRSVAATDEPLAEVAGVPVLQALLVDGDGRVAGFRLDADAASHADAFAALAGAAGMTCPDAAGPCETTAGGLAYRLAPGAEGWLSLTAIADGPLPTPPAAPPSGPTPPFAGRLAAFLAGATVDCNGCALANADLRWFDLRGADLAGADLSGAILHGALLTGADLDGANLSGANLNRTELSGATFRGAMLPSAMLFASTAREADFSGADLSHALMGEAAFDGATFDGASLDGADLGGSSLAAARLFFATLRYSSLGGADLSGADLRGIILSDALAEGARFAEADLTDAVLARTDFTGADFTGANLGNADLTDAVTASAVFDGAVLP